MSSTQIFGFDKNGNAYLEAEVKNAWRGAMAVWRILEEKYLPPYRPEYIPAHIPTSEIKRIFHFAPTRCSSGNEDAMQEVWALANDNRLKECEKIVLLSTFDYVVVKKENLHKLISAFREFEGETSLKEQADIIEKMLKDENCIAVAFNQTSICMDDWVNGEYDEEKDEYKPYNIFKGDKHWELFDELK